MSEFNPIGQASDETQEQDGALPPDFNEESDASVAGEEPAKPRNNGLLVLITLLAAGAGVVYFMHLRAGPKTAAASAEASSANATISQFLNNGEKNMRDMRELLKNTEKFVQQFKNDPSATQVKLEELKTDPFRFSKQEAADHSAEELAKLAREREKQKLVEKETIVKAAQQLQIQSILTSGRIRTCMINNAMYTEGQTVNLFKIEKINPDGVLLTRGGYRLQLKINR
jgi:uncharacterized protein HemX